MKLKVTHYDLYEDLFHLQPEGLTCGAWLRIAPDKPSIGDVFEVDLFPYERLEQLVQEGVILEYDGTEEHATLSVPEWHEELTEDTAAGW